MERLQERLAESSSAWPAASSEAFAIASNAPGGNEFAADQRLRPGRAPAATFTAFGFANVAVMGGKGSIGGNGLRRAALISRALSMRCSRRVRSESDRGPRISKEIAASLIPKPIAKAKLPQISRSAARLGFISGMAVFALHSGKAKTSSTVPERGDKRRKDALGFNISS